MSFLVALIVGFGVVVGITGLVWLRNGRDPRSLDDPSLLAAAPPDGMTAATATLVAGGSTHDAFIAALLDLASRDEIAFESEETDGHADRVGIAIRGEETDDPRILLHRRRPIGEAEVWLLDQLRLAVTATAASADDLAPPGHDQPDRHRSPRRDDYISARRARTLREPFLFGTLLGTYAKRHGWMAGITGMRRLKWRLIGIGEVVAGMVLSVVATNLFSDVLIGLALGVGIAGAVTYMTAGAMAARTREGARMKTQLAAYARTLRATFAGAASMDEAVAAGSLRWLETPDQAIVWGMALGLRAEIEALLSRTAAPGVGEAATRAAAGAADGDGAAGGADAAVATGGHVAYCPTWYVPHRGRGGAAASGGPAAMFAGIERIGSEAPPGSVSGMMGIPGI